MRRAVASRPRTYLRKPTAADERAFVAAVVTSEDHLRPYVHAASTPSAYRQWLTRGERADTEQFLVCTRDGDELAGFVNLNNLSRGSLQQAAAGWASFAPHVGRGHLTDGVELVLELAFTQLRLHRVEANIQPPNAASRALALRCGFRLEGFSPSFLKVGGAWRDHERWAIVEDEWRERMRRARTR